MGSFSQCCHLQPNADRKQLPSKRMVLEVAVAVVVVVVVVWCCAAKQVIKPYERCETRACCVECRGLLGFLHQSAAAAICFLANAV